MLRRYAGDRPKRSLHGSKTPCSELKEHTTCSDLCCRNFLVTLAQDDIDDGLERLEPFIDVLQRHERGHCYYFDEATTRCTIHEKRPMPCRAFDCREDARSDPLRHLVNTDVPFVKSQARDCEACGNPLKLSASVMPDCGGRAICLDCGAGYQVEFQYGARRYSIDFDRDQTSAVRRANLLRAHVYHERFAEALPLAEALVAENPADQNFALELGATLAELGRWDEARAMFERFPSPETSLELAWLDRRQGRLDDARERLFEALSLLPMPSKVRACVELGRIALARGEIDWAARWFVSALRGRAFLRNPMLKEFVLDLLHGSPQGRDAIESFLLSDAKGARAG